MRKLLAVAGVLCALIVTASAGTASAVTYVISIPGTITSTANGPGPLDVGDTVTLSAQFSEAWFETWGSAGYMVAGAKSYSGTLPQTGPEFWRIDAEGLTWGAATYPFGVLFPFYSSQLPVITSPRILAGPAIIFTETSVLGLSNLELRPAIAYPSFATPGVIGTLATPGNFPPLTFGATGFSTGQYLGAGYTGQTAQGQWDFAHATVSVLGAAAVPEPATWAMLIIGFGLVGAAMRRRGLGLSPS